MNGFIEFLCSGWWQIIVTAVVGYLSVCLYGYL